MQRFLEWFYAPMRAIVCGALSCLLLLSVLLYYFISQHRQWQEVKACLAVAERVSQTKLTQAARNSRLHTLYQKNNPSYLHDHLETLSLLEREKKALAPFLQETYLAGNEGMESRYRFLSGGNNQIHCLEKALPSREGLRETLVSLSHPVEVDSHDIQKILSTLEGASEDKPLLIITECKLNKKTTPNGNEVFEHDVTLIKREFLS